MGKQDPIGIIQHVGRSSDGFPVIHITCKHPQAEWENFPDGFELFAKRTPLDERETVRFDHAQWSQQTFGNVGPVGPLKHLSKEAMEAAAQPDDLSEWADMQFLMWDAQRRSGITDEQITHAMIEKLAVNKSRQWPAPQDGEPRMHIKDGDA